MLASSPRLLPPFLRADLITAFGLAIVLAHPYTLSAQRLETTRKSDTATTRWAVALLGAQVDSPTSIA